MKSGRTLTEIAQELQRQVETKKDFIAPTRELEVLPIEGPAGAYSLRVNGHGSYQVGETAHSQIAQRLGIPQNYYDRMRRGAPDLLARNVNHWLRADGEAKMVRTLDGSARAFLSRRFRPLDNPDLCEAVLPTLGETGAKIVSAELTDSRLYIKAVLERLTVEVKKGDVVQAGIVVSNSEIGMGSVKVEPLVFRLVCLNGMIAPDAGINKYHVGRSGGTGDMAEEFFRDETRRADDRAFWLKVRDVVAGAFQRDAFERIAARLTEAASEGMSGDPVKAVEVVQKRFGLGEIEKAGVLSHLVKGGDLSRWGMVNALTAASQDVKDYDRATDLERFGGQVLELPRQDWRSIAEAK